MIEFIRGIRTPPRTIRREISAHFAKIYGASISRETVSRITEKVVAEMQEWAARPLDAGRFLAVVANHSVAR